MNIQLRQYRPEDKYKWDIFCANSTKATFLHSKSFLDYHGDKFQDKSVIIESQGRWLAIFPAAVDMSDSSTIVSHPGATYGGFISAKEFYGEVMLNGLTCLCKWYSDHGFSSLIYKALPFFYHERPAQDDIYALFRVGATLESCGLSSTIDLENQPLLSQRRRRNLKRAHRSNLEIKEGKAYLPEFWPILAENLARKFGVTPVHSLEEIVQLADLFPENILCIACAQEDRIIAGIVIFTMRNVYHAQYIASSQIGYEVSALDFLFEHTIKKAKNVGKRWFDFGVSTENGGKKLNEGLYSFKAEIGGGGTLYEAYKIKLNEINNN